MSDAMQTAPNWEETLLSSLLAIVKTPDGDFDAINRLAMASAEPHGLQLMIKHLTRHPQGQQALQNHSRLGVIDLAELSQLPPDTLGCLYAEHMIANHLQPLQSPPATSDYQYVGIHITETHDIWHIVTDSDTDILGEVKLQAFCVAQFGASQFWLALLLKNLIKSLIYDIEVSAQYLDALTIGWQMGKAAQPLFGTDWSLLWSMPIAQVRSQFNVVVDT